MRRAVTAGLLGLALGLAGCGGDELLSFEEANIEDPEGFLTQVERLWAAELDGRDVSVHDEARCYFADDTTGESLDDLIYCGPVRHAVPSSDDDTGDAEAQPDVQQARQGAWDTYIFSVNQTEGQLVLSSPTLDLLGTSVRANRALLRPDGLIPPDDADNFAQSAAPTVDSGFVTTSDDVQVQHPSTSDTVVTTPLMTAQVDEIGTASAVDGESQDMEAPDGETLRAVTLSFSRGPYANAYDDAAGSDDDSDYVDATVEYFVDVGDERTPILEDGTPERPVTVIASVPDDGDADLVIAVDGLEQSISLTSGERTSDTAAAFYLDEAETTLDTPYPASEQTAGDFEVSQSLRFDRAALTPFHPRHGWAEEEHAWLVVTSSQVSFIWNDTDYAVTLEREESAILTLPDGDEVVDETATTEYDHFAFSDTLEFVFEVPADDANDGASVDLEYAPALTFTSKDGSASPASGEVTLEPVDFSIDLPGE